MLVFSLFLHVLARIGCGILCSGQHKFFVGSRRCLCRNESEDVRGLSSCFVSRVGYEGACRELLH